MENDVIVRAFAQEDHTQSEKEIIGKLIAEITTIVYRS